MNSAASPRLVRIPNRATPLAAVLVVRMNFRRVMLLIDISLSRYDDLTDVLRGSELKSQADSTELLVRLRHPQRRQPLHRSSPQLNAAFSLPYPQPHLFKSIESRAMDANSVLADPRARQRLFLRHFKCPARPVP